MYDQILLQRSMIGMFMCLCVSSYIVSVLSYIIVFLYIYYHATPDPSLTVDDRYVYVFLRIVIYCYKCIVIYYYMCIYIRLYIHIYI